MRSVPKILIVEDNRELRGLICRSLKKDGYRVAEAEGGRSMQRQLDEGRVDLIVLDIMLPGQDGLTLCRNLRAKSTTPVIFVSAKDDDLDKVLGLKMGADDYLVKPFHIQELLARIEALIRRASGAIARDINIGPVSLDTKAKSVRVNGSAVELTAFEFNLLEYLMMRPGHVVSKTALTEHLYFQDFDRDSNVIEVFVGRLRRKLDPENQLRPIETVRGQGYRFGLAG